MSINVTSRKSVNLTVPPHPTYRNGIRSIVGKFSGSCWVAYGPYDLSYTLYLDLARWFETWFFSDWVVMRVSRPHRRGPEDPATWSDSSAQADMPCRDGKYRIQSRMYIRSASLGIYTPYPGHKRGGSRNIEC